MSLARGARPGTRAALAEDIARYGWEIGEHTYGVPQFFEQGQAHLSIGKYTSIATGVNIVFSNHRTDAVSTYPFVTLAYYWPSAPVGVADHVCRGDVRIGNDVWIAANCFIGSGVTIGDGAVVGAQSVVVRDVPAYAVVAGNPARVLRYRFSRRIIAALLVAKWWDWADDVVDGFLPLMMSGDVEGFLTAAGFAPRRRRWWERG